MGVRNTLGKASTERGGGTRRNRQD